MSLSFSNGRWRSNDSDIDAKLGHLKKLLAIQNNAVPLFQGALVATDCDSLRIVGVPPHCGIHDPIVPTDLDILIWIPHCEQEDTGTQVMDIKDNQLEVDRFPFDSDNVLECAYTFFYQPQPSARAQWNRQNQFIAKLTGNKASIWYGDLLVIKTKGDKGDGTGILNIESSDLLVICEILQCITIDGRI